MDHMLEDVGSVLVGFTHNIKVQQCGFLYSLNRVGRMISQIFQ